jgi:hypothetical protein
MMRRGGMGMRRGRTMRRRTMRRRTRRRVVRHQRRRRRRLLLLGGALVLGGAYAGHKLSKRDADQIEQASGKSVDEMSDEELKRYMDERGIQPEPLNDEDRAYLEQQGADEGGEPAYLDELERLAQLKDEGVITEDEFEAKKKELLGL